MLQIDTRAYASDALEDAMRLAQIKALNSFTFSDCINYLNYAWSDIYSRMAMIDDGYYGVNVQLTEELTKLPPFVKNSVMVYAAQSPTGHNRQIYRSAGTSDMTASGVYRISGTDLWCPDARRRTVWLYYVPACPQIFFTHHNRDPRIFDDLPPVNRNPIYNLYNVCGAKLVDGTLVQLPNIATATREELGEQTHWFLKHRGTGEDRDISEHIIMEDDADGAKWRLVYIGCDYPYIFLSYEHSITGEHRSGFLDSSMSFTPYNPFDFTGRPSDVEYNSVSWNDKTGLGVQIIDYRDVGTFTVTDADGRSEVVQRPRIKEIGWTPDTLLDYPIPEMYRYLVARLADKLSALNESSIMGVQRELIEARFAFEAFLDRDKSSWKRIENVNTASIMDWLV